MSSVEVARAVRSLPSDIYIVWFTGNTLKEDQEGILDSRCRRHTPESQCTNQQFWKCSHMLEKALGGGQWTAGMCPVLGQVLGSEFVRVVIPRR